jgi:quercetin dioxygenase-like cupin family protein
MVGNSRRSLQRELATKHGFVLIDQSIFGLHGGCRRLRSRRVGGRVEIETQFHQEQAVTEPYVRAGTVNWIAKGSDVGVQERTLGPGQQIPWHYHTIITDTTYCLEGSVQIEMLDPPQRVVLAVGESFAVPAHRPHKITPHEDRACRFLLVQGVGQYDRHPIDAAQGKT